MNAVREDGAIVARQGAGPLLAALLAHAPQMSFFRFCELMELAAPQRAPLGAGDSPADEAVRFRSRQGLGFPGRELDRGEQDLDDATAVPFVRTSFLGLYGVDARMPSHFIDQIAQNREGAPSLAAFLDIFHHRIVTQFYRVWRKYRYPVGFREGGGDAVSSYLLSFVGLGFGEPETRRRVGVRKLLSMLGVAAQKTRTAEGLAGILRHAVPEADIAVQEFYPVWIAPDAVEPAPLGQGCLLGRGFYDRANAVRVVFRPRTRESLLGLMPGQAQHLELMALLRFYLGYELQAHLHMEVDPTLLPTPVLSAERLRLGYTARLRDEGRGGAAVQVRLGIYDGAARAR